MLFVSNSKSRAMFEFVKVIKVGLLQYSPTTANDWDVCERFERPWNGLYLILTGPLSSLLTLLL